MKVSSFIWCLGCVLVQNSILDQSVGIATAFQPWATTNGKTTMSDSSLLFTPPPTSSLSVQSTHNKLTKNTSTVLQASASTMPKKKNNKKQEKQQKQKQPPPKLDVDALTKYGAAIAIQMTLFAGIFTAVDAALEFLPFANTEVPFVANCIIFWLVALKSRVLNPLNNSRPQVQTLEANNNNNANTRIMPTWTPPGVVFPIMWLLIIGPIRAVTTAMVYDVTGSYANLAILSLMLHLSVGDVWNTINNVERRYGASVTGIVLVWLSNAHAAYQYYQVSPMAGQLLCLPLIWLTVAGALITRTWQLNPDEETGELYPLFPAEGQGTTTFKWFSS